jgi:RNA polymerase sigma factor (sigma-70 family)
METQVRLMTSLQRNEHITSYTQNERITSHTQVVGSPDSILVRQALAGDEHAFESLVYRYHNALLGYVGSYLKDREQASDVVQFVFLQLFVTLPTLVTKPVKAWLYTVARNRSLDELRKRRFGRLTIHFSELEQESTGEKLSLLESIIDPYPLPEEIVERLLDIRGPLQRALFTLLPTTRSIVMLHSVGQLSFSEIARQLKMQECTVKTRYYRSLSKLRAALIEDHEFLG